MSSEGVTIVVGLPEMANKPTCADSRDQSGKTIDIRNMPCWRRWLVVVYVSGFGWLLGEYINRTPNLGFCSLSEAKRKNTITWFGLPTW